MSKRVSLGTPQLPEGSLRGYEEGGRLICLARTDRGYRALDDWCNHAGCLISGGSLERTAAGETVVVCPCHEVGFEVGTGRNATSPGICGDQQAFPLEVDGSGELFVLLPDEGETDGS